MEQKKHHKFAAAALRGAAGLGVALGGAAAVTETNVVFAADQQLNNSGETQFDLLHQQVLKVDAAATSEPQSCSDHPSDSHLEPDSQLRITTFAATDWLPATGIPATKLPATDQTNTETEQPSTGETDETGENKETDETDDLDDLDHGFNQFTPEDYASISQSLSQFVVDEQAKTDKAYADSVSESDSLRLKSESLKDYIPLHSQVADTKATEYADRMGQGVSGMSGERFAEVRSLFDRVYPETTYDLEVLKKDVADAMVTVGKVFPMEQEQYEAVQGIFEASLLASLARDNYEWASSMKYDASNQLYTSQAADSFASRILSESVVNSAALSQFTEESLAGSEADSIRDSLSQEGSRIASESAANRVTPVEPEPQANTTSASQSASVAESQSASTAASEAASETASESASTVASEAASTTASEAASTAASEAASTAASEAASAAASRRAATSETPVAPTVTPAATQQDLTEIEDEEVPLAVNQEPEADTAFTEIEDEEVPLANMEEGVTAGDVAKWSIIPLLIAGGTAAAVHERNKRKKAAQAAQEQEENK